MKGAKVKMVESGTIVWNAAASCNAFFFLSGEPQVAENSNQFYTVTLGTYGTPESL